MFRKNDIRKNRYQVYYMGWKECLGIHGKQFTDPIVRDLATQRKRGSGDLISLTLQVSGKCIKMSSETVKTTTSGTRIERMKYPSIPAADIAYATVGDRPNDNVVAVIILGYNPTTNCPAHAHGYLCDSPESARLLANHFQEIIQEPQHHRRLEEIELDLISKEMIRPSGLLNARSPSYTPEEQQKSPVRMASNSTSDSKEPGVVNAMNTLTDELKKKLSTAEKAPVLYPPKDYDTWSRSHGNCCFVRPGITAGGGANGFSESGSLNAIPELPPVDYDDADTERDTFGDPNAAPRFPSHFTPLYSPGNRMATSLPASSDGSQESLDIDNGIHHDVSVSGDRVYRGSRQRTAHSFGASDLRRDAFVNLNRSQPAVVLRGNVTSPSSAGYINYRKSDGYFR